MRTTILALSLALAAPLGAEPAQKKATLLNASYDPTRELYTEVNARFVELWRKQHGAEVEVLQSHGGSGKQARAVIDGLEADVVTLALAYDVDMIARTAKLLPDDWRTRLPHGSVPYTSTIVFLVRKGNPKGIRDWGDLVKEGVEVITPNPKTSGGARWNYLAAWGWALRRENGSLEKPADAASQAKAEEFVKALFARVPVLDSGARGSTTTFVQRGIGDVLLAWENEAFLSVRELGADQVEIVWPSLSILAEPPVALVDKVAEKKGTKEVAQAYLEFLYSKDGQALAAKHGYRPRDPSGAAEADLARFAKVETFRLEQLFGSWDEAQKKHFEDGGVFDRIYARGR